VRQVAGKVVRAKLVLRVKALSFQVVGPLLQHRPISCAEIRIALHLGQRGQQDEHVAGLLDRHLILLRAFASAIDLAVRLRISAQVVGRKGPTPTR
jgi:hypothetical protein